MYISRNPLSMPFPLRALQSRYKVIERRSTQAAQTHSTSNLVQNSQFAFSSVERMRSLGSDESVRHSRGEATTTVVAEVSKQYDELVVGGREGRNVVPLVVRVGAGELLATGDGLIAILREDHLDTLVVIWVDNSGDIEISGITKAVEAELGQHARHVGSALRNGVGIADPVLGDGLVGDRVAFDDKVWDLLETGLCSEYDSSCGAVLVDEVKNVFCCCQGCERGGCKENSAVKLHFEGWLSLSE